MTYEAARVPNPDRIYFDLHGARLAQELVGKSFTVTDDGFLKKIRAAQYSDDVTRIVLDVNDVTEYSAFLLPNPYRLIIDIHGGAKPQDPRRRRSTELCNAPPRIPAVTVKSTTARPVPNTVAAAADVARTSRREPVPGKVEATSVAHLAAHLGRRQGPQPRPGNARIDGKDQPMPQLQPLPGNGGKTRPCALIHPCAPTVSATPPAPRLRSPPPRPRAAGRRSSPPMPGSSATRHAQPAPPPLPPTGETSLVRALGLKIGRIVIDAGHGGHDSGTIGVDGIEEKDVVLDVALRLGKLLHERLGAEIIYTRSDDTFIPLETRTAIANKAQADLFLSIHANSSPDASARGVETYYLNFTQQTDALAVAARENAVSDQSIHQLSDLVKKIALKDKIAESREFATDVETSLYAGLQKGNEGLKNRGVKKAPFVVLIGANMPSDPRGDLLCHQPAGRRPAPRPGLPRACRRESVQGVARYAGGLGGTRPVATLAEQRASGQ